MENIEELQNHKKHCCEMMDIQVNHTCEVHKDLFDCPDHLISYSDKRESYGLIIHDGGASHISIAFCPWCGVQVGDLIE